VHVRKANFEKDETLPQLPVGVVGVIRWHKNSHDLGFTVTNARGPGDAYSFDINTGKIERWTNSETAVKTNAFPQAELVKWKTFEGKEISGFLYRPPAAKFPGKRPVLVVIHGGPEGQSQPIFPERSNYYLNELGIALIYPNVRGSTGYGKTFSLLDNGFQRENTYKDINSLFDWIGTQSDLDAGRICVTGGSYGGHMTLAVSTFYSDRIKCSVDIVGMSNLVTFLEHTEAYRRDLRRVEYGDERDPKTRLFGKDRADEQHRKDQEADDGGGGQERSARSGQRKRTDCGCAEKAGHSGLVSDGQRRRAWLPQKDQPGFSVLRDGGILAGVFAEIDSRRRA
jgi:dipeptidyl aminopeptidase/acylaminoacyl peptidase